MYCIKTAEQKQNANSSGRIVETILSVMKRITNEMVKNCVLSILNIGMSPLKICVFEILYHYYVRFVATKDISAWKFNINQERSRTSGRGNAIAGSF